MIIQPSFAVLGNRHSFHAQAALSFSDKEADLLECHSFDAIIEAVQQKQVDYGVMATENSLAGLVDHNLQRIVRSGLFVQAEILQRIELCLAALPGASIGQLKEVVSHPMALKQCRLFLEKHRQIKAVEGRDTSAAAQSVAGGADLSRAAITSPAAAAANQLHVLSSSIEDQTGNQTRFWVLGRNLVPAEQPRRLLIVDSLPNFLSNEELGSVSQRKIFVIRRLDCIPSSSDPNPFSYQIVLDLNLQAEHSWSDCKSLFMGLFPHGKIFGAFG